MMVNDPMKITPGLERHLIGILTVVIVALILWVGSNVQQAQVQLAAIEVEINHIKQNTANDKNKFHQIEKRLDAIERALHKHDPAAVESVE